MMTLQSDTDTRRRIAEEVERRLADRLKELEKTGAHFRVLAEQIPAAYFVKSPDGALTWCNETYARLFNTGRDKLLGRKIHDYLPEKYARQITANERRVLEQGIPTEFEETIPAEVGVQIITSLKFPLRDPAGHITGLAGIELSGAGESRLLKQSLKESEKRLSAILNSITNAYMALDSSWRFLAVNPAAAREVFGRPAEELIGRIIWEMYPEAEGREFHRQYEKALLEQVPVHFEARSTITDKWLEVHAYPGEDRLDIHFRDISDRKTAEENLQHQTRILQGINLIFTQALASKTEEELGVTCLRVAEEITGSRFGFIGEIGEDGLLHDLALSDPGWKLCTMHDQSGHRRPPGNFPLHGLYGRVLTDDRTLLTNRPADHPDAIGLPDGHPPLTSFLGVPLKHGDRIIGIIGLANREGGFRRQEAQMVETLAPAMVEVLLRKRAQERLKASEERFRTTFDRAAAGLVIISPDRNYLEVNDRFCEITGYSREEQLGRSIGNIIHPDDQAETIAEFEALLHGKSRSFTRDIRYLRADGSTIWVWATVSLMHEHRDGHREGIQFIGVIEDIDAQKRSREVLRKSEERYRSIFEQAAVGIVYTNLEGRFFCSNQKMSEITGYSEAELTGLAFREITHPDDLQVDLENLRKLMAAEISSFSREKRYIHKDGNVVWVSLTVSTLKDKSGNPRYFVGIIKDINDRKKAEEALAAGRATLETALNSMTDAVVISDALGNFLDFNDAFATFHRFRNKEECARTLAEYPAILDVSFADGKPAALDQWPVSRALRGEADTNAGYILRRRDTGETWVGSYSFGPIRDHEGEIVGSVVTGRDITELKRAEEERQHTLALLEGIATGAEDQIAAQDGDFRYLFFNDAYKKEIQRIWGRDLEIGMSLMELLAPWPKEQKKALELWRRALKGESFSTTAEFSPPEHAGQIYDMHFNPVHDKQGRRIGAAHIMRNITERRRAEEERERLITELEEAILELEGFTYSVSHDLRAPIRHLASYAQLLKAKACPSIGEECGKYLQIIANAARRLGILVDELLEFSRMGRTEMEKRRVDLQPLVDEIVTIYAHENKHRQINWQVDPLPWVSGDQGMLHLVFCNLIGNAVKFTAHCPIASITIGSFEVDDNYVIYVKDNGIGFDMQYHDMIFGVFHRLHTAEEFEGTGIGLANVQRIIRRHGGRVWAEGKVDKGATFYIALPREEQK